jgi:hypothetical protein
MDFRSASQGSDAKIEVVMKRPLIVSAGQR